MKRKAKKLLSLLLALALVLGLASTAMAVTFTDVPTNAWYYKDVYKAVDTGLINGYPNGTFGPDRNMTYAEAVKLAAVMHKLSAYGNTDFDNGYPWYEPYMDYAIFQGIIDHQYAWDSPATRAGYMEIFAKAIPDSPSNAGVKALTAINNVPDGSIPDVPMTHPQAAAIYKLYRAGILQGNDTATHACAPNSNIKRSEVAAILTRMMSANDRLTFDMGTTAALTISSQPKDVTVAVGGTASFTVAVSGGKAPYKYQWRLNETPTTDGNSYNGSSTATFTFKNVTSNANGYKYSCVVTDAEGKSVTSNKATLTVTAAVAPLTITSQPKNTTVTVGGNATFSVTVSGGTGSYTYQWYNDYTSGQLYDGQYYSGVTTATMQSKSCGLAENGSKYWCVITDAAGNSVTTDKKATLTVTSAITKTATMNATVGQAVRTEFKFSDYGIPSGTVSWDSAASTYGTYGLTGPEYTGSYVAVKGTPTKAGTAFCRMRIESGSTTYHFDITINITAAAQPLKITSHPANTTVSVGANATFTVAASGGKTPYKYEWHRIVNGGDYVLKSGTYTSGVDAPTMSTKVVASDENGDKYYCIVTDAAGNKATSNKATLTVNAATQPLKITTQPANKTITAGQDATFTVAVTGGSGFYTYEWHRVVKESGMNVTISATNSPSFSGGGTPSLTTKECRESENGDQYYCVVKSGSASVTSNSATLTVNAKPLTVTKGWGTDTYYVPVGKIYTFKVTASGGKAPYTYQWQLNNGVYGGTVAMNEKASYWSGTNTDTLSINTSQDLYDLPAGIKFRCAVTDSAGKTVFSPWVTVKRQ